MQIVRAMKWRPAQTSAGLREPSALAAGVRTGFAAAGGVDSAATAARFGGAGRCVGGAAAAMFAADAIAAVVSGAIGAASGGA